MWWCAFRIAIEQQASLVPVLALGEALQLRNLYDIPSLQQYTYRRLGFPGEWGGGLEGGASQWVLSQLSQVEGNRV